MFNPVDLVVPLELAVSVDGVDPGELARAELESDFNQPDMAILTFDAVKGARQDARLGVTVLVKVPSGQSIFQGKLIGVVPKAVVDRLGYAEPGIDQIEFRAVGTVKQLYHNPHFDRPDAVPKIPRAANPVITIFDRSTTRSRDWDGPSISGELTLPLNRAFNSANYPLGSKIEIPLPQGGRGESRVQILRIHQTYDRDSPIPDVFRIAFWGPASGN